MYFLKRKISHIYILSLDNDFRVHTECVAHNEGSQDTSTNKINTLSKWLFGTTQFAGPFSQLAAII